MKIAERLSCPHCGHPVMVAVFKPLELEPPESKKVAAPTPAPNTKEKVRYCACGHPKDMHAGDAGPCTYGRGHAMGGCPCERYHSRRRGGAPISSSNGVAAHVTGAAPALSPCATAILHTLVQRRQRTTSRAQAALMAGYRQTSGSFSSALAQLRKRGLIEGSANALTATVEGVHAAGAVEPLLTGAKLIEYWCARLNPCACALLQQLTLDYPRPVERDELAQSTGYRATSGSFSAALAHLRTLGLVKGFKATRELMEE